jgi:hypothetical protein
LDGIPVLPANPDVDSVADEFNRRHMMPAKARLDALHVATAALAGVQYLLNAELHSHRQRHRATQNLQAPQ